jgi:hypothetical protein
VITKATLVRTSTERLGHRPKRARFSLRVVDTLHLTHAEAAEAIFGDAAMARSVEGLLTRGRPKLAAAWRERRAASGAGAAGKVSGEGAENTGGENA